MQVSCSKSLDFWPLPGLQQPEAHTRIFVRSATEIHPLALLPELARSIATG